MHSTMPKSNLVKAASNLMFLGSQRVSTRHRTSIHSAVFAQRFNLMPHDTHAHHRIIDHRKATSRVLNTAENGSQTMLGVSTSNGTIFNSPNFCDFSGHS